MYKIKQLPEDFMVREISSINPEASGQYAYFILKKTNYTTIGALEILSKKIRMPLKNFGFAGNKDRNAVTEQAISIFRGSRNFENYGIKNIELKYLGNGKNPISLGDLEGNEFIITIRNLDSEEIKKIKNLENKKLKIPNLYGPQRFSKNNHLVGKEILKRDFKKAIELILESKGFIEEKIKDYLKANKNNYIEALRLIPLKTRKLFVHSYQSFLFNRIAGELKGKNVKINDAPIIGFNFEIKHIKSQKLRKIAEKIMDGEKISPRDFIISQIPELTAEGTSRSLFFELKFRILETGNDELNRNMKKIEIKFTLPKSCYATVALEFVFQ